MQEEADGEDRRQEDAVGNKSSADLWTIRIVPPFSDDSSDERETSTKRKRILRTDRCKSTSSTIITKLLPIKRTICTSSVRLRLGSAQLDLSCEQDRKEPLQALLHLDQLSKLNDSSRDRSNSIH